METQGTLWEIHQNQNRLGAVTWPKLPPGIEWPRTTRSNWFLVQIQVFPSASHCLSRAGGNGWLAVGDALVARDPLSSTGIDYALASAERAFVALQALAGGLQRSLETYSRQVQDDFDAYLAQRRYYYAMECRWPDAVFWQRRQGRV